jgi:hypothetical protein
VTNNDEPNTEERKNKPRAPDTQSEETPTGILEETLLDIIKLALDNGLTEEDVDTVLYRIVDKRSERMRSLFRLHQGRKSKLEP